MEKPPFSLGPRPDDSGDTELRAAVADGVALLEEIDLAHHAEVVDFILFAETLGQGLADLVPYFQIFDGIDRERAQDLALWQVRRVRTAREIIRYKQMGWTKFKWQCTNPDVCAEHVELGGQVFPLGNPPVIDKKTGRRAYPGDLIGCHCLIRPVMEF